MESNAARAEGQSVERMVFFSDAVFAIVITLLVLPLAAESDLGAHGSVASAVWDQWPRMLGFVISFLVIGQFWIAHHAMFGHLHRLDLGLLWLNLLCLLTVTFIPFPTSLLGSADGMDERFPVVFYAASMTVSSVMITLTWLYCRVRGLLDPDLPVREARVFTGRALVTTAVFGVSVVVALLGLLPAVLTWVVGIPLARVVTVRLLSPHHPSLARS